MNCECKNFIVILHIQIKKSKLHELMKKVILLFMFILSALILNSQESQVKINHEGKDFTKLKHAWQAQWITHPTESTLDYGVFLYRRTFQIDTLHDKYIVYVSADNKYKLYVNGEEVCEGPARGDLNNWRFETINIAPFLRKGKNVIAAQVVNFGEFRHGAQQTFQTAFILQSDDKSKLNLNTGKNNGWKIIKNYAYDYIPFTSDSVGGYYVAGPGDKIDASKYPWGWNQIDFDESHWLSPRLATVEFAVGRGFLFGSTWYLVPRMIPFMKKRKETIKKIIRVSGIDKDNIGTDKITIPPNSKVSILYDNRLHTVGFPELVISKGKNAQIKITYAEALFEKSSKNYSAHGGWEKLNRNNFDQQEIRGYYDIIMADGGAHRKFSPLALRVFRFVQFDIETKDEPLIIDDYYNIYTAYPFDKKAGFISDNDTLSKIWDVAWRTLQNSSQDVFLDPYYEQLQYVGDARIESLISLYVAGDDRLMRKAIQQFDNSRLPIGLTQSRFPSYIVQVIPTYSLLWIDMIHDYYMYRDDPEFLRQFVPGMRTVLDWFKDKVDSTGMLANLDWWNFTDWTKGFQNGIPPGADDGHSANISLQFVLALQNAAEFFNHFGLKEEADKYKILSKNIQNAVMKYCYAEEKGLIAERPEKDVFSQHTNIFAILTNTFENNVQDEVMDRILSDTSLIKASIYFRFYLHRAMQKTGAGNRYLDLLQPWENMLNMGMTTFGETDVDPRSECHAWSASPCFDFLHLVGGIYPVEPSFKSVVIEPNLGKLKKLDVKMPHPKGLIKASYLIEDNKFSADIILPEGLKGVFKWNGKEVLLKGGEQKLSLIK